MRKMIQCECCKGKGEYLQEVMVTCPTCNGRGEFRQNQGDFSCLVACSDCQYTGKVKTDAKGKPVLFKKDEDDGY
jgi:DnaJ-class molecular chaperone